MSELYQFGGVKMANIFILLYGVILYEQIFCQKWLTPTNRVIYSIDGKAENLSWKMDYVGKRLFNARWTVYNDITQSETVLVSVAGGISTKLFHPNITSVKYMSFKDANFTGKILFHKLESSSFHRIGCVVSFHDEYVQFQDFVHIRYASYIPVFTDALPSQYRVEVGNPATFTVTLKGNPGPSIIWRMKNKDIISNSRIKIQNVVAMDSNNDTVIISTLHITKLEDNDNGVLEVIGKYGRKDIKSPIAKTRMDLNVLFAPKNILFTTNITTNKLKNDNYIKLSCTAKGNPPPMYKFKKVLRELYYGTKNSTIFYVTGVHEARFASFSCTASNSLGTISRELDIDLDLEDHKVARYIELSKVDSRWWIYFITGAVVLFLIFLTVSILSCFLRKRMRSMTIAHGAFEETTEKRLGHINYGISNAYMERTNQHYNHFTSRKSPDANTTRRKSTQLQGFANNGFSM